MKRFVDKTARIEQIIHLQGMLGDGTPAEPLEEFFTEHTVEELQDIFKNIPEHTKKLFNFVDAADRYEVEEYLIELVYRHHIKGFLVKFATPEMKYTSPKSRSYSWGFYNLKWIYGETLEEVLDAGFKWVESLRKMEKEKYEAEAKSDA